MRRRTFLQWAAGTTLGGMNTVPAAGLQGSWREDKLHTAAGILADAVDDGRVEAASLYVRQLKQVFARSFGASQSADDMFLLASISKPMSVMALMTLYDGQQVHSGVHQRRPAHDHDPSVVHTRFRTSRSITGKRNAAKSACGPVGIR